MNLNSGLLSYLHDLTYTLYSKVPIKQRWLTTSKKLNSSSVCGLQLWIIMTNVTDLSGPAYFTPGELIPYAEPSEITSSAATDGHLKANKRPVTAVVNNPWSVAHVAWPMRGKEKNESHRTTSPPFFLSVGDPRRILADTPKEKKKKKRWLYFVFQCQALKFKVFH